MTSTPRRPGFRLPWSNDAVDDTTDASAAPQAPADAATAEGEPQAEAAVNDKQENALAQAPKSTPTPEPVAASAPAPMAEPPDPFLQELVGAMRRVAEETRDKNLAELRTLVEKRVEQVEERGSERAEDLRRRSELDIKGIGDWERGELDRVRTEAERKVEARRKQLEQQLHDHQESSERDAAVVRGRLSEHERNLEAFFTQLSEIKDPAVFVVAAKRMPSPPSLDAAGSTADPAPSGVTSLKSRMAMLGIEKDDGAGANSANGVATPKPVDESSLTERLSELDEQRQPKVDAGAAPPASGEVSTAIVVKGLGSFGAITSFKQSLEKIEGIKSVTLSLGPTGEFVYRATHDAGFDLDGAIAGLEGGSAELERETDGTLRITVTRSR